jgi:putative tricarboxylic transport membrane protein
MTPKAHQNILLIIWILVGLLAIGFSCELGLVYASTPGPGLVPFLLGLFIIAISLFLFIASILRRVPRNLVANSTKVEENHLRILIVSAGLFAYAFLLDTLGYLICAYLLLVFLFRITNLGWKFTLLGSIIIVLLTNFGFDLLGVQLPKGIIYELLMK